MESYKGMDDVVQCFTDFVNKVPFYGAAIICLDDPNVQLIIPKIKRRRVTYGMTAQADVSANDIRYNDTFGSTFHASGKATRCWVRWICRFRVNIMFTTL